MSWVKVVYPALSRNQVTEKLKEASVSLRRRLPGSKMILYGSYAQGHYAAGSDIDVIVVYRGELRENAYKVVMDEIELPRLEPKVYSEEQFNKLIADSPRFAETLDKEGVMIPEDTREGKGWSKEAEVG